jgi:hypothetical protein
MSGRPRYVDADMNAFRRMIAPPPNTSLFRNYSYNYMANVNQPDQYVRTQKTPEEIASLKADALDAANRSWYKGAISGVGKTLLFTAVGAGIAAAVVGTGGLALPVMGLLGVLGIGTSVFQISKSMEKWTDTKRIIERAGKDDDLDALTRAAQEYAYQSGDDMGSGVTGLFGSVFSLGWFGSKFGALSRLPIASRFKSLGGWRGALGFGSAGAAGASVGTNAFGMFNKEQGVYWQELLMRRRNQQQQQAQPRQDAIVATEETPMVFYH